MAQKQGPSLTLTLLHKPFLDLLHIPLHCISLLYLSLLHFPFFHLTSLTWDYSIFIRRHCSCCIKVADLRMLLLSATKQDRVSPSLLSRNTLFTFWSLLYTQYRGTGYVGQRYILWYEPSWSHWCRQKLGCMKKKKKDIFKKHFHELFKYKLTARQVQYKTFFHCEPITGQHY